MLAGARPEAPAGAGGAPAGPRQDDYRGPGSLQAMSPGEPPRCAMPPPPKGKGRGKGIRKGEETRLGGELIKGERVRRKRYSHV